MDKFLDWYNNKKYINYLKRRLRDYIHVNGTFKSELDVRDTIDDVIQDTFFSVYKKGGMNYYNGNFSVGNLIISIAENKSKEELKRKKRWKNVPLELGELENENIGDEVHHLFHLPETLSPDECAELNELNGAIKKGIHKLSKINRDTLMLKIKGYSHKEIGELFGIKWSASIERVCLARTKLKEEPVIKEYYERKYV